MIPIVLLFAAAPAALALAIALKTSKRKKITAWIDFALLATPLVIGGGGTIMFSAYGLAWRTAVKGPCVFVYCAGLAVLLLWAYIYLFRQVGGSKSLLNFLLSMLILGVFALIGFWYMLFGAAWMGNDCEVETSGGTMVKDCGFMCDVDYYAYHGPLVRGAELLRRDCT